MRLRFGYGSRAGFEVFSVSPFPIFCRPSVRKNSWTLDDSQRLFFVWHPTSGWWFQIFFIFTNSWEWFPFWLIFFTGNETTNYFPASFQKSPIWRAYFSIGLVQPPTIVHIFMFMHVLGVHGFLVSMRASFRIKPRQVESWDAKTRRSKEGDFSTTTIPHPCMSGIFTYIYLYLPTWMVDFLWFSCRHHSCR